MSENLNIIPATVKTGDAHVRIVKRKDLEHVKYWHILKVSGKTEAKFKDLRDALDYCEDHNYTCELGVDDNGDK